MRGILGALKVPRLFALVYNAGNIRVPCLINQCLLEKLTGVRL